MLKSKEIVEKNAIVVIVFIRKKCQCLLFMLGILCYGQNNVQGVVLDEDESPLFGATVKIGENKYTSTNEEGRFVFEGLKNETYDLRISMVGFFDHIGIVTPNERGSVIRVILKEEVSELSEVVVAGKTKAETKRSTGYDLAIIETKKLKNLSADINQVIKITPGINIRESGGLGSGFKLSLNGLSGNQIRYFIDGVPMENFGTALTLNNYPINLIESIEIYKGVVPISFGADALGGAINIVTENKNNSFIDASYGYGSFNTHRFALNTKHFNEEKKQYYKINSFFNHSDNDFLTKDVPVYDENGNNVGVTDVRRFHDQYTSGMLSAEFGMVDRKIADHWQLKATYANNKKEYQHPDFNILRPFGDFNTRNSIFLLSSAIRKKFEKVSFSANVLAGSVEETIDDTGNRKYNWINQAFEREPDDPKGELFERKSLFKLNDGLIRSQFHVSYQPLKNHGIEFNLSQNYLRRKGRDEVDELNRSFTNPNHIEKYVGGIAYGFKDDSKRFDAVVFVKEYIFKGKMIHQDPLDSNVDIVSKPSIASTGYGASLAFRPSRNLTLKGSYEKAYRLPEPNEILGDGIYISPNSQLKPEISDNINLGVRFNKQFDAFKIKYEGNVFYRFSDDFIQFKPAGVFGNYANLVKVTTKGIENGISLDYKGVAAISSNVTYQNITEQNEFNEGQPNSNYKGKVPNTPFFFANVNLMVRPFHGKLERRLTLHWNTRFVHEFFLKDENGGNREDKHTIPTQLAHGLDVEYTLPNDKLSISASVTNLTNELLYDNFRIQRPGRAMALKLRYSIK